MSSSLSAKAAVFVPGKSWQPGSVVTTGGQPQQIASAGPPEFVPGRLWAGGDAMCAGQPQQWSNGDEQFQNQYVNSGQDPDSILMVKDVLSSLITNPGLFEDYMQSLVQTLNATITTDQQLGAIADIIFEQSVLEPNFRYTGARACNYLTTHLKLPPHLKVFRVHINQRVKDAVESREQMAQDPIQMGRLHGATMFLAELFLNTELQVQGYQMQRIKIYRVALKELMETLVNNASSENLKCLGLLLKLSGKEIEEYDKGQGGSTSSKQISEIFDKARQHVMNDKINKGVRALWVTLIELRASKWGQAEAASSYSGSSETSKAAGPGSNVYVAAGGDAPPAAFSSQPVFYNSQGQVISAAEAGFGDDYDGDYESYVEYPIYDEYADPYPDSYADPYADYDLDPSHYQQGANTEQDYADDLDDLDAEIQAAFSDFLIETGQGENS